MKLMIALVATVISLHSIQANADTRIFKYKDGSTRASTNYLDNKRHGVETWFFRTGEVKSEVNYLSGLKQGFKIVYNKNGVVLKKRYYRDNQPVLVPTPFSITRDEICNAKFPNMHDTDNKFRACSDSFDNLFSEFSTNPNLLPLLKSIKDFYLTSR